MITDREILIVDDIAVNRMLLSEIIEILGYKYSEARNGKEAVDQVSKKKFFLVLMDVEMPVMNGIEATVHIKKNLPAPFNLTKIIGVTAHDPDEFFSDYVDIGFDGFITKPYTLEKMDKELSKIFAESE